MPNPLSGGNKTNITAVETALNTAINALNNVNDSSQANARVTLIRMRKMLEHLKSERAQ